MNMAKCYMKFVWNVCLSKYAELLGFRSAPAQNIIHKCYDHHKTMEILQGFYSGTSEELLTPYVRHCLERKQTVNVNGYFNWIDTVVTPNYKFLTEVVFTHLLGLMLFRCGVRRYNSDVMMAGRSRFTPLFYLSNHPKYREIDYRDHRDRYLTQKYAPEPFRYLQKTESFT